MNQQEEEEVKSLIPGLPDELGIECLVRVPQVFHIKLQSVCKTWLHFISSPFFHHSRLRSGHAEHLLFLLQPSPPPSPPPPKDLLIDTTTTCSDKATDSHIHQQHPTTARQPPQHGLSVYNATYHTWRRITPITIGGNLIQIPLFCQCVAIPSKRKLLLLGGWDPVTLQPVADVYVLDVVRRQWKRGSPMTVARSFFGCAAVGETSVYVAGGHDSQKNALRAAEVYDVEGDEWRKLSDMEEERDECEGLCWEGDDKFWVVSGYGSDSQGAFRSDAECYDPKTGSWTKFDGVWPFSTTSPRGTTAVLGFDKRKQHRQWLWFLPNEQLQQQRQGERERTSATAVVVGVPPPKSINGTCACFNLTTDHGGQQKMKERVFVMTGNGTSSESESESKCNECTGEMGFIMERDGNSNGEKINWSHVHTPSQFTGFPYSASCLLF